MVWLLWLLLAMMAGLMPWVPLLVVQRLSLSGAGMKGTGRGESGGDWITMAGTSMATPHVAGLAALLLAKNPSLGPNDIRTLIRANAVDKGASGFDNLYGYGRINAKATWDPADGPTPGWG